MSKGGLSRSSDVLTLLSNFRRREILRVLLDLGGEASLREVVRRVAEKERGTTPDRRLRKSVYTGIIQTHLPKLNMAGIVEYDKGMDTLRLLYLPDEYRYYLETVEVGDIPWSLYYLAISTLGVVAGVFFTALTGFLVSSIFILAFSLCLMISAVLHTASTYGLSATELIRREVRKILKIGL